MDHVSMIFLLKLKQIKTSIYRGFSSHVWLPEGSTISIKIVVFRWLSHTNYDNHWILITLEAGWWFQLLWKILVNWNDYSQYMEKSKSCSKPPTSNYKGPFIEDVLYYPMISLWFSCSFPNHQADFGYQYQFPHPFQFPITSGHGCRHGALPHGPWRQWRLVGPSHDPQTFTELVKVTILNG